MKAIIEPGMARGKISAPPSKSCAHRLLICAALAAGESRIDGVAMSQDILATMDCVQALGAEIREENGYSYAGFLIDSNRLVILGNKYEKTRCFFPPFY